MKIYATILLVVWSLIPMTAEVMFGSNDLPAIVKSKDFNSGTWTTVPAQTVTTQGNETKSTVIHFTDISLYKGAYCYVFMQESDPAPLAVTGFKNGSFNLATSDLAGPNYGYREVDANGWPCIRFNRQGTGVWRQYRLLNQPFAPITLTLNQ